MNRRKKQDVTDAIRLRFRGRIIELTPTAAQPVMILQAQEYEDWVESIPDITTNTRINNAVAKMRRGLTGDWKEVGGGVFELRLDFGPGYRVYYARYGNVVIVLLGGGDKSSQQKDITSAVALWKGLKNDIKEV